MRYLIGVTDLHGALIEGIRQPNDMVLNFPKRGSRGEKIAAIPKVLWLLTRIATDRASHVVVSHPFNLVPALCISVARELSLYDDGIAYYADSQLPQGPREKLDRWLTGRFFDWRQLSTHTQARYVDLVASTRVSTFFAMYPDLIDAGDTLVSAIDMRCAFPPATENSGQWGITLFLDTRDEFTQRLDRSSLMRVLREAASTSPDALLHFKPHPTEVSRISAELRSAAWAKELRGDLESDIATRKIRALYSFHSSGAIAVRVFNPQAEILSLFVEGDMPADGLRELFARLGATELLVDAGGN